MTLRRAVRSMLTKQKCEEHWPIQRAESIQLAFDIMNYPHVRSRLPSTLASCFLSPITTELLEACQALHTLSDHFDRVWCTDPSIRHQGMRRLL